MLERWDRMFPGQAPVAHQLREAFPNRWVRFHSLPGSKRYPQDESEYRTAIARQHSVIGGLLALERQLVLLTTGYSQSSSESQAEPEWSGLNPHARLWRSVSMNWPGEPVGLDYWHIFASEWDWPAPALDQLLRLVADDVVRNVMIVAQDCRWVVHPYDGGMDVIMESETARNELRSAHLDWLSPRSDGC